MTRETKMFKNKTDGFDPDVKLAQVKKNRPAKHFKHFEGTDWKDPWEIDREIGMSPDAEDDEGADGDYLTPILDDTFVRDESDYGYVPFY